MRLYHTARVFWSQIKLFSFTDRSNRFEYYKLPLAVAYIFRFLLKIDYLDFKKRKKKKKHVHARLLFYPVYLFSRRTRKKNVDTDLAAVAHSTAILSRTELFSLPSSIALFPHTHTHRIMCINNSRTVCSRRHAEQSSTGTRSRRASKLGCLRFCQTHGIRSLPPPRIFYVIASRSRAAAENRFRSPHNVRRNGAALHAFALGPVYGFSLFSARPYGSRPAEHRPSSGPRSLAAAVLATQTAQTTRMFARTRRWTSAFRWVRVDHVSELRKSRVIEM